VKKQQIKQENPDRAKIVNLTTSFGISVFDMPRGHIFQLCRCRRESIIFRIDDLPIVELRTPTRRKVRAVP
jgi:hypothetical protein